MGTPRSEFAGGVSAASLARGRTPRGHGADDVPGVEDGFPVEVLPGTQGRRSVMLGTVRLYVRRGHSPPA